VTLRVAITRALPDAERTAERVRAMGAQPILTPLLTIIPCAYDTNVEDAQAILFTSAYGVRAFPDARRLCAKPVLAVGDATAEAARGAGFSNVCSAEGDVSALTELAKTALSPNAGKLVHIGGEHVAGDLAGEELGVGLRAFGDLTVVVGRHSVAALLAVLGEQDQRCRVRGLQRQHQRQQYETAVPRVELVPVGRQ
jgi:uroporphyrinogen-III synthase